MMVDMLHVDTSALAVKMKKNRLGADPIANKAIKV